MPKMSRWTKCNLWATDRDILQKFQNLQRKYFSTVLENFTEIFLVLQTLQLLQYFILCFKIVPKNNCAE